MIGAEMVMAENQYADLRQSLFAPAPAEGVSFILAGTYRRGERLVLTAHGILSPARETDTTSFHLSLPAGELIRAVNEAVEKGCVLIEAHTHPFSAHPRFSSIDERGLRETVPYMLSSLPSPVYGATVWGRHGLEARAWHETVEAPLEVGDFRVVGQALRHLPLTGQRDAEPWLATPSEERSPSLSPDGSRVAYMSNDSGRREVYVRPYAGSGGRHQVSTQGGHSPQWSHDGREIFFESQGSLWSAAVRISPSFASDQPRKLFDLSDEILTGFDVSPDGQRFVMVQKDPFELRPLELVVVPGWIEELKARLAPAK